MAFGESAFSGVYGGAYRLRVQADVVSQNPGANTSLVRYSAWMEQVGGNQYSISTNMTAHTNIDGFNPSRNGSLQLNGQGQRRYLADGETYTINHGSAGEKTAAFGADLQTGVSQVGNATVFFTTNFPQINRYADIVGIAITEITDVSFRVNNAVSPLCDWLQVSYEDGFGWRDVFLGDFYYYDFYRTGLASNTTYSMRIRVRRKDSGLWTESGIFTATTSSQGNFIDLSGM